MLDFYRFTHFQNYPSLLHAVSQKSTAFPFAFSLALHTGEDPKEIVCNRTLLSETLGSENSLHYVVANQTHSDNIKIITKIENRGWGKSEDAIEDCDALITNLEDIVLTILTADCVPILLYDKEKKVVAAVHAGWKGTKADIVGKTVQKMKHVFGCEGKNIIAGIAPSIGACCYEVGEEVAKHFFHLPESVRKKDDKYMLDLPKINQHQLLKAGLTDKNIEMSAVCTACNVTHYFSYRKEKGCSGRFMSMIGLKLEQNTNRRNKMKIRVYYENTLGTIF